MASKFQSPIFSIITVNFNNAVGLEKTIISVKDQTLKDYEHLIIDANSNDRSVEILEKYSNPRIRWISEPDRGIYDGMNKGGELACGKFLQFLNSGDTLLRNTTLEEYFEAISISDADIFYTNIITHENFTKYKIKKYKEKLNDFYLCIEVINHQSQIIKRSHFKKLNGYNLTYSMASDYDFFARSFKTISAKYRYIPIESVIYDLIGKSSSEKFNKIYAEEKIRIQEIYFPKELSRIADINFFLNSSKDANFNKNFGTIQILNIMCNKILYYVEKYQILRILVEIILVPVYKISLYINKKIKK